MTGVSGPGVREAVVAEALWKHEGYDLDADPASSTTREMRPVFMAQAAAVLAALDTIGSADGLSEDERQELADALYGVGRRKGDECGGPVFDAVERILAARQRAADERVSAAVEALLAKWDADVAGYPTETSGGKFAAAAVRLCGRELRAALAAAREPVTGSDE